MLAEVQLWLHQGPLRSSQSPVADLPGTVPLESPDLSPGDQAVPEHTPEAGLVNEAAADQPRDVEGHKPGS